MYIGALSGKPVEFSCEAEVSSELFRKLCGIDMAQYGDNWSMSFVKKEQIRKHKKRRINKKWAKKYGFRDVVIPLGNYKITKENGWIEAESVSE